ncbi:MULTISPECIES: ArsR/SmtB family transcription factor [unclassified Streptomyces]|uniref:ArsR/SmtB family transcription factor n=1 Tax=unclassified Streptomyces TaxID=2593676 RepID=UPI001F5413CD|nr:MULTISPECIES: metalloregulator ArsR/SmtB family transcription factor [unclassified Streptomyces]
MDTTGTGDLGDAPGAGTDTVARVFAALASPARLRILQVLTQGPSDVTRLVEQVGGAASTVSQHLFTLRRAGFVDSRREGRRQVYFTEESQALTEVRRAAERLAARQGDATGRGAAGG